MSVDFIEWPDEILPPQMVSFTPHPFTRSGGRSLGGISRSVRTDKGFWIGSYSNILFRTANQFAQRRVWNAIRTYLGGTVGLIAVPICSSKVWAAPGFMDFAPVLTTHDDGTTFDDGTSYYQGNIDIQMSSFAPLGSTVVTLKLIHAPTASGIRFSYQHALYETGRVLSQPTADTYQVEIFPAIRQAIPAGASLEADRPTVLCHLASDSEMDIEFPPSGLARPSISFVEAVDTWNSIALGEAA